MSKLLDVPKEVSLRDIRSKGFTWSPAMHRTAIIPTSTVKPIRDLLVSPRAFDKGIEPGSISYMRRSQYYLVRTKALQDDSCLIYPKGDATTPVNPRAFVNMNLSDGDILMSGYFNLVVFPCFPRGVQEGIARLYQNPARPPEGPPTLERFVAWHRQWNDGLGVWELDREMKVLRRTLMEVQRQIIEGKTVTVPLADGE